MAIRSAGSTNAGWSAGDVRALGAWLAERHRELPTGYLPNGVSRLACDLTRAALRVARAFPELAEVPLQEIEHAQRDFLANHGERIRSRDAAGRVGLHPGTPIRLREVCVSGGRVELRCGPCVSGREPRDAVVDAASLALDFTMEGCGDLAERLLSAFAAAADDFELYGVIDFYERQCAIQRVVDLDGGSTDEARRWLLLGLSTCRRPVLPPVLIAVGGLVASGKSTIARLLADRLGAPRIEADRAREFLAREFLERAFLDTEVYEELVRRAEIVLSSGRAVVLDACFPRGSQRSLVRDLAHDRGWPFVFVECRVDPATASSRLAERDETSAHAGWAKLYANLARHWEPVELPRAEHVVLDCAQPVAENAARLDEWIVAAPVGHPLP